MYIQMLKWGHLGSDTARNSAGQPGKDAKRWLYALSVSFPVRRLSRRWTTCSILWHLCTSQFIVLVLRMLIRPLRQSRPRRSNVWAGVSCKIRCCSDVQTILPGWFVLQFTILTNLGIYASTTYHNAANYSPFRSTDSKEREEPHGCKYGDFIARRDHHGTYSHIKPMMVVVREQLVVQDCCCHGGLNDKFVLAPRKHSDPVFHCPSNSQLK